MRPQKRILYFLLTITIFVISCDVSTLVAPPQNTAPAPNDINVIVAQTAAAAGTQTAKFFTATFTPSVTPSPTRVPTDTPTITPTFIFIMNSPTSVPQLITTPPTAITPSAKDFECLLTGQSPINYANVAAGQDFQVSWSLANMGRKAWDSGSVDFVYLSGTRLYKSKGADLPKTVAPGEIVTLKLTMTSPNKSGTFKTVWALQIGENIFCTMPISIVVP